MGLYGLFVGINEYVADSGFASLRYACKDATNLQAAFLRTPTGMEASGAILITDETLSATVKRSDVLVHLSNIVSRPTSADTLLFYFAGHGFFAELGGKGTYLAASDVQRDNKYQCVPSTAISIEDIRDMMVESQARHILLILDACRTDPTRVPRGQHDSEGLGFGGEFSEQMRSLATRDARMSVIFSACSPESPAIESDSIQAGLWTHSVCSALDEHAKELLSQTTAATVSTRKVFDLAVSHLAKFKTKQSPRRYARPDTAEIPLLHKALITAPPSESPWHALRAEIDAARSRISRPIGENESAGRTPLKRSRRLEDRFGCRRLYFKLENIQNTGSFKFRGATNAIERLHGLGKRPVVVAASAGNHGLGVAVAAKHRGLECHIFMPEHTPLTKSSAVRLYTPHVELKGEDYDACQKIAMEFARSTEGAEFIHAFNDPYVVAGQGTIGLELLEDWAAVVAKYPGLSPEPDFLIIPCGGGGLLAGIGTSVSDRWNRTRIIAVEPECVPSLHRALEQGSPVRVDRKPTIADGIAVRCVGADTLAAIQKFVKPVDVWGVSENNIAVGILSMIEDARVLAEGAGAAPLAGMIEHDVDHRGCFKDKTVVCVISGGNVDISSLSTVVSRGLVEQDRRKRLRFEVHDRPGALADITRALADARANIVELIHHRYGRQIGLGYAEVDVEIETNDAQDAARIFAELSASRKFKVKKLEE